ncbi:MAG TPA: helix-turn-helix transcriptional regulator [Terriglobales bacterium]|nr:helix-turn-helix transcriptional regulator [Terriglobales bacterium]
MIVIFVLEIAPESVVLEIPTLKELSCDPGGSRNPAAKLAPAAIMLIASRRLICAGVAFLESTRISVPVARHQHFVYHQSMDVENHDDVAVSRIAAAIGEPARARMLYCLIDGRARTSTELAVVAAVTPSTASVHLHRLNQQRLVKVSAQGKHRYYSLEGSAVGNALEALSVLAGAPRDAFVPNTPSRLRAARTCYDHIAGTIGVALHDRFKALHWLSPTTTPETSSSETYDLTPGGTKALASLGIDIDATRSLRRRFAFACLDWSERRPHIGGALAAALLKVTLKKRWFVQDLDSRALAITALGQRELEARFRLKV